MAGQVTRLSSSERERMKERDSDHKLLVTILIRPFSLAKGKATGV
jgi:hypothetical protein